MSDHDYATGEVRMVHPGPFELAEGPFWHPGRECLFWFSVLDGTLHAAAADGADHREWRLGERASAAGIIDDDHLAVATETGVWRLALGDGTKSPLVPLEADDPRTRSNDGRVAPDGAFWIGTMGLAAEDGLGAIYRYDASGTPPVTSVRRHVTIPNSICFSPDGAHAYLSDTRERVIRRLALVDGVPSGEAEPHIDLRADGRKPDDRNPDDRNTGGLNPDGAVTDAEGHLWCACWGAGEVVRFAPDGTRTGSVRFPARQVSCPAFGGPDMTTMFVTTAHEGMDGSERTPGDGAIYAAPTGVRGRPEPNVRVPASA